MFYACGLFGWGICDMKKSEKLLFGVGIGILCLMLLPSLILGENAVYTCHDQLDGEMIAYILNARHLGNAAVLPEFMNGAPGTALTPPAPLSVLLFTTGHYQGALFIMQLMGCLVGYIGMFLLSRKVTGNSFAAFVAGGLYGALGFLPVYGFSQYGLPLLLWCLLEKRSGWKRILAYGYALLYALNSSLVLVGFAVLLVLFFWILTDFGIGKKENAFFRCRMGLLILAGYLCTNASLILQLLGGGENVVSHKAEYLLVPENFLHGWLNGFFYGGQHSQAYHLPILIAAVLVLGISAGMELPEAVWRNRRVVVKCIAVNLALCAASALWNTSFLVAVRKQLGALGAFQAERLLWLAPCLWYLLLACSIAVVLQLLQNEEWRAYVGVLVMLIAVSVTGVSLLKDSEVKNNVQKLRNPSYGVMSFGDYYACGVYEQVEAFLKDYTGKDPSGYRVASLGIEPAAALYHGFYCLDGYSNNYPLEYKHAFRKVIAPELARNDYLRDYFDEWGNRCYLVSSECPGYSTIEKGGFFFSDLELDVKALKEL